MAMQHRPEYQLSSQSPVLTARFHPFDTHVIIGGTYSGQVRAPTIDAMKFFLHAAARETREIALKCHCSQRIE